MLECRRSPTCGSQLALDRPPHVRLCGKGGKWRHCPLWNETASILRRLIEAHRKEDPQGHVFRSITGKPLTRFGLYKRVRRLTAGLSVRNPKERPISHLTACISANCCRAPAGSRCRHQRRSGWLGHANLTTTNRYAEITTRMKAEAIRLCEIPLARSQHTGPSAWRGEASLLEWLSSL